ncbi:MAG TPA: Spy/CpxP family protein refolding chaperone [Vicinamibacterales bacterium]|jgi:Spy/CpxP family protein refolding chaperone|nr:Spy/CpxP family protein refolding chaperone [Vicinamibacterales bacterium]
MARHIGWALAALLSVGIPVAGAQPPQPQQQAAAKAPDLHRKWWMDAKMRAELGITDQQSAAVEAVWQQSLPRLRDLRHKVDDMDNTISQMIRDAVDEPTITAELDRAESTRAELNKGRTLMLYRMNRVLTADQRAKLKAMWEREHGSDRRRP